MDNNENSLSQGINDINDEKRDKLEIKEKHDIEVIEETIKNKINETNALFNKILKK